MKRIPVLLAIIFLTACDSGEQPAPAEANSTNTPNKEQADTAPEEAEKILTSTDPNVFVPEHYAILDSVSGDLNLDGYPDLILVLKHMDEEETSDVNGDEVPRPLLILTGQADQSFQLAKRNDNTVYCFDCGGMMGDPYAGITIKDAYFSVEHYGGSGSRWVRIITYKYSKADNEWYLHKDGRESYSTMDPNKVESNSLTTKDFGQVKFEDFNISDENE